MRIRPRRVGDFIDAISRPRSNLRPRDRMQPSGTRLDGTPVTTERRAKLTVKITPNDRGNHSRQTRGCRAPFYRGASRWTQVVIGFSIWSSRAEEAPVETSRSGAAVSSQRRATVFALLRPVADATAQARIRELILDARGFRSGGGRRELTARNGRLRVWRAVTRVQRSARIEVTNRLVTQSRRQPGVFLLTLRRQRPFPQALCRTRSERTTPSCRHR